MLGEARWRYRPVFFMATGRRKPKGQAAPK